MTIQLIIISLIIFIILKYLDEKNNTIKQIGDTGERIVANELSKLGEGYRVYNSIEKELKFGKLQVDHIVFDDISKIIYVIETKNYHGLLVGGANDKEWKRLVKGKCYYYTNPIIQNSRHCNAVRKRYTTYKVKSLIVFANNNVKWNCSNKNIVRVKDMIGYIKNSISENQNIKT